MPASEEIERVQPVSLGAERERLERVISRTSRLMLAAGDEAAALGAIADARRRLAGESAMRPDDIPVGGVLTEYVVACRAFARSRGLTDGVEHNVARRPPDAYVDGPLAQALARVRGLDAILSRMEALLRSGCE